jgi:hypothetical protein
MKPYLFVLIFFLISCNGGGGGGGGKSKKSSDDKVNSVEEAPLSGIWEACEDIGDGFSMRHVYLITDNSLKQNVTLMYSSTCDDGSELILFSYYFIFEKESNLLNAELVGIFMTALDPVIVDINNEDVYCEYSDWALGVPKNVDNKLCGESVNFVGALEEFTVEPKEESLSFSSYDEELELNKSFAFDFSQRGQQLPNGNYVYYYPPLAIFATLNSGSYQVNYYNVNLSTTSSEAGVYTSINNLGYFTISDLTPSYCFNSFEGDVFSRRFSSTDYSLSVDFTDYILYLEQTSLSKEVFEQAYGLSGFSSDCLD